MQQCTSTARNFCLCGILFLLCDFERSLRQEVVVFITSAVMNFGYGSLLIQFLFHVKNFFSLIWLRWVTPAIAEFSVGEIKERIDKIDDANKTLSTTVSEGDPRYSSFSAEMKFVPVGDTRCEAVWTATYQPVGDIGPPEHIKQMIVLLFKSLEQAVLSRKTLSHTEVDLAASPDAIWDVCKRADELLPKYISNSSLHPGF